jgi:hypothetical protein
VLEQRAHYGSAATEIAICLSSVGVAFRRDRGVLEVSGEPTTLDALLPGPGQARYVDGAWLGRLTSREAVVLGSPQSLERWQTQFGTGLHRANAVLALIGPRAEQLLGEAGFVSAGDEVSVQRSRLFETDVVVLRESRTWLTVIAETTPADPVWNGLLRAGRPFGALPVGCDAIDRLTASRRFAATA